MKPVAVVWQACGSGSGHFTSWLQLPRAERFETINRTSAGRTRIIIEQEAIAWAVALVDEKEIDEINILNASILAMHRAVDKLTVTPEFIIVDGNKFKKYGNVPHQTIVKGDSKYPYR